MIAAEKGQSDLVTTLLEHSDVNARDGQGMTALMLAVAGRPRHWIPSGHKEWTVKSPTDARTQIVEALLLRHADPNLQTKKKTPRSRSHKRPKTPRSSLS